MSLIEELDAALCRNETGADPIVVADARALLAEIAEDIQ